MRSLHVNYDTTTKCVSPAADAAPESWEEVCERFNNDVKRILNYTEDPDYSALYACYDEDNQPVYYLVEESEALMKLRHRNFLEKLGHPQR